MDLKEKASYIKGLLEGTGLDFSKEENKILKSVVDLLLEMSEKIYEIERKNDDNSALIDELDEDLANVEKDLYNGENVGCDSHHKGFCSCNKKNDEQIEKEMEEKEFYEISCQNCGRVIEIDDEIIEKEDIICPECGKIVNFDFK